MGNSVFQSMGGQRTTPGPMTNMANMMQQFKQFKAAFQGDPKAEVMRMLQSGKITQAQLNQAQDMARQFQRMMNE